MLRDALSDQECIQQALAIQLRSVTNATLLCGPERLQSSLCNELCEHQVDSLLTLQK